MHCIPTNYRHCTSKVMFSWSGLTVESDLKNASKVNPSTCLHGESDLLGASMSAMLHDTHQFHACVSSQTVFTWIRLETFEPILTWISAESIHSTSWRLTSVIRFDQIENFQSSSVQTHFSSVPTSGINNKRSLKTQFYFYSKLSILSHWLSSHSLSSSVFRMIYDQIADKKKLIIFGITSCSFYKQEDDILAFPFEWLKCMVMHEKR